MKMTNSSVASLGPGHEGKTKNPLFRYLCKPTIMFSCTICLTMVNDTVVLECRHQVISSSYFPAKVTICRPSSLTPMAAVQAQLNKEHDFIIYFSFRDEDYDHGSSLPLLVICRIEIQIMSLSQSSIYVLPPKIPIGTHTKAHIERKYYQLDMM